MEKRFSLAGAGKQDGMSVTEMMVAICIVAILAAAAIPAYINYVQQARVVSLIIPRLHLIETSVGLFYALNKKLPGNSEVEEIVENIDLENLEIVLANGTVVMTIQAMKSSKLRVLDGKILVAAPVITKDKIVSWHLTGELADRLKINH